jgi:hypothetical protein
LPSADFCGTVTVNLFTFSHDFVTCRRSPEVSSTAFHAQPPNLPPVDLMDMGFAITCSLAAVGLLSGSCSSARAFAPRFFQAPPRGECYFTLALRHDFKGTFTLKLSDMLGTQQKARLSNRGRALFFSGLVGERRTASGATQVERVAMLT